MGHKHIHLPAARELGALRDQLYQAARALRAVAAHSGGAGVSPDGGGAPAQGPAPIGADSPSPDLPQPQPATTALPVLGEVAGLASRMLAISRTTRTFNVIEGVVDKIQSHLPETSTPSAPDSPPVLRVHFLRSFTTETIDPFLKGWGLTAGLLLSTTHSPIGQFEQIIMEGAGRDRLRAINPQVVVVWPRLEELAPSLAWQYASLSGEQAREATAQLTARMESWLTGLREALPQAIIIHMGLLVPPAPAPALGLADSRHPMGGEREAVSLVNRTMEARCRKMGDTVHVDLNGVLARVGTDRALDPRMEAVAAQPYTGAGLDEAGRYLARVVAAAHTPRRKCLVLDCDNTLWGGIVGEDGMDRIQLGPGFPGLLWTRFQERLLNLHRRGIILAIASRNNEGDVMAVLDRHPHQVLRREHFAAWRINWGDKATSIRELAGQLNIGLDSMVFLDDSPFEVEMVRQNLPQVLTVKVPGDPLLLQGLIDDLWELDTLEISPEDRRRGEMYLEQSHREQARLEAPDLESFFRSLEMDLTIEPVPPGGVDRIAQLTRRTNQFNLTTTRYSTSQVDAFLTTPGHRAYQVRLSDRFGDFGVCGACLLKTVDHHLLIDTLLLSCRVLGRGVEGLVLRFIEEVAGAVGVQGVMGLYRPTAKNRMVADLYKKAGFSPVREEGNGTWWVKNRATSHTNPVKAPQWFRTVNTPSPGALESRHFTPTEP